MVRSKEFSSEPTRSTEPTELPLRSAAAALRRRFALLGKVLGMLLQVVTAGGVAL